MSISSFYIPYWIFLSVVFNVVLSSFGIKYLYVLVTIIGVFLLLVQGVKRNNTQKVYIFYFYVCLFFLVLCIQFILEPSIALTLYKGLGFYILFPLYWFLYFQRYSILNFIFLLDKTIKWIYIVALFGVIQYFFSPNLFGLLDFLNINGIKWAMQSYGYEYMSFFRITSILGSSQVYGLFLVLYIIMILSLKDMNKFFNKFGVLFLIFSAVL